MTAAVTRSLLPKVGSALKQTGAGVIGTDAGKLGVGMSAPFLAGAVGAPIIGGLTGSSAANQREATIREGYAQPPASLGDRLARLMEQNRLLLATMEPHLYAELMADRTLAKGTRVYGSARNPEAVKNLLLKMTQGNLGSVTGARR